MSLAERARGLSPETATKAAALAAGVAVEAGKSVAKTPANVMTRGMS